MLLGFSSEKALEDWVSELFGNHIDKPVDKLPAIVEAICKGNVGKGHSWTSKLDETNNAQLVIQTPTNFFDSIVKERYEGVPQVQRFVSSCNKKFDKACELGAERLRGNGLVIAFL